MIFLGGGLAHPNHHPFHHVDPGGLGRSHIWRGPRRGQPSALPQDPQRRDGRQMLQVGARITFQNYANIYFQGVVLEEVQDPDWRFRVDPEQVQRAGALRAA